MQIVEKFVSINGEGPRAGQLAVFIRSKGCNLACSYCDTKWANEPGQSCEEMDPDEIAGYVLSTGVKNVTLTGGEPLLQDDARELIRKLTEAGSDDQEGLFVEIETNGTIPIPDEFADKENLSYTMDWKTPSSGYQGDEKPMADNVQKLRSTDTVKFVCGTRGDLEHALEVIREHGLVGKCNIYISPVFGEIEASEIVAFMAENRMNGVNLQLQLHKYIWDPQQRGV